MQPFVAIDFETANEKRGSACSIGLAQFDEAGEVVATHYQLLHPHKELDYFRPINTWVHGVKAEDVADAPEWGDVYASIQEFIGDLPIVAHNMAFDGYVLNDLAALYGIDLLENPRYCTVLLSRRFLGDVIERKSLDNIFGYYFPGEVFQHHHAYDDAVACGRVFARMQEEFGLERIGQNQSPKKVRRRSGKSRGEALSRSYSLDGLVAEFGSSKAIRGEQICITGKLEHGKRSDIQQLISKIGGTPNNSVLKKTTILVVGTPSPGTFAEGASASHKLEKATKLREKGSPILVMSEKEFFQLLMDQEDE